MEEATAFDILSVDDCYFSALFDEEQGEMIPVSDEKYAGELQLQEVIMSSILIGPKMETEIETSSPPSSSSSSSSSTIQGVVMTSFTASSSQKSPVEAKTEFCESSHFFCEICADVKGSSQMFNNERCHHCFCSECITKYVATKIQHTITSVQCPGLDCKAALELDACRPMLPKELLDKWDDALTEAFVLAIGKCYCPFEDCSAVLIVDESDEEDTVSSSECPECHRLFCACCNVPWHPGIQCEEYQKLNESERGREDLLLRELAMEKKWKRCPRCMYFVEKMDGCLHVTCRCHFEFCYACGQGWTSTHGGCQ